MDDSWLEAAFEDRVSGGVQPVYDGLGLYGGGAEDDEGTDYLEDYFDGE